MARVSRLLLVAAASTILLWKLQPPTAPASAGRQAAAAAPDDREASFRIILGLNDTKSTVWDGSLTIAPGSVARLEPWRFDDTDRFEGPSAWKISTHPARVFGAAAERPVVANGMVATFGGLAPSSEVSITTAQGKFSFRPADVTYGKSLKLLDGRVFVDRVPVSRQLTASRQDEDYPSAAVDRDGTIWVAYLNFAGNPKFGGIRMSLKEAPKNMAELAEPTGSDQIFVARYARGAWSEPIAVSAERGDLYRPAVALDGAGRVWVFWSANDGGNFDLYARPIESGKAGKLVRLTSDRGADIDPVAATDAQGNVWVAWQAFRGGRAQIRASRQARGAFGAEQVVASSSGNEWNPAIAASAAGEVAIAWDSYRNGNYDVYVRTFDARAGAPRPGSERAVASSARYEAYPTLAYDGQGKLWIAWEESDAGWGKDFGAYETSGIGLYQGRWIRAAVRQGERIFSPPDLAAVLPGAPNRRIDAAERQGEPVQPAQPDPQLARKREPSRTPQPPARPMNSYPRLAADRGGRIWLAYRTVQPIWWTAIGTVWFENVVALSGSGWSSPIFVPHSDNLLDNRPALASTSADELVLVGSSDGRQQFPAAMRSFDIPGQAFELTDDPYNNDLYAARIVLPPAPPAALSETAAAPPDATPPPERPEVRRLRDYRARIGGVDYRIQRGEFHRHTEVSMDAGRDGSLRDAWRYAIDAAALDWIGCCDHDNGFGREYTWWLTQKLTDVFLVPGTFTSMFNYERSVQYPEGHRNIIFARRGIRTLPRLPRSKEETPGSAPDTRMLYAYLRHFGGIVASHTSGTNMGTDWRDNDPDAEPVVEIYQGDRQNYEMPDAPRSNSAKDSIGGWREKGFVSLALQKGYRLAFQASSDHISTHMSYCNLYAAGTTREALLDAFRKRHVYGATDDILADVRSGSHMMGDQFETSEAPSLSIKLVGTAPMAKVHVIKDGLYVHSAEPKTAAVDLSWRDMAAEAGKTSYYYVRGEQVDGEIVWASPMWITYRPAAAVRR